MNGQSAAEDRRVGLVAFGILDLLIAIGYLIQALALALISITGVRILPKGAFSEEVPFSAVLKAVPAVFFLALGIGSILGRRWARSLSLAFASLVLAFGALTAAALSLFLPAFFRQAGEKSFWGVYACIAFFAVVLPGAYVLFYRSPRVKAACEWLDPEPHWTDRCSVAVLSAVLLLAVSAMLALGLAFSASRQILFLGAALGGGLRSGIVAVAAAEVLFAWQLARGKRWAWIAAIAITVIRAGTNVAIVRGLKLSRIERLATVEGPMSAGDKAKLAALAALHPLTALAVYVGAISLLAVGIVVWSGRSLRSRTR